VLLASLALLLVPASAAATGGASGSFQILGVQNGVMQLSVTVTPGPGACESLGGIADCDWYAVVDVENAPGGNCQLYATSDPSGTLGSQTNGDAQTAQEPLDTQVAAGQCMLTLQYNDISGDSEVLAQQAYTFPAPTATFSGVSGTTPVADSVIASASVTLSEPICPSDGACAWFGFVLAEPASSGCPAELAPDSGPAAVWVGSVLDSPGTENATVSQEWDISSGPLLWCGYIDGPGVPGSGAGLVGQATYTPPTPTQSTPQPSPQSPTSTPKPEFTMTLGNIRKWAWSAAVDRFYGARSATKLSAFRVSNCKRLSTGRFRCNVSWQKKPYAFAGTVTMGNLNGTTGHFEFGFSLNRRNMSTGTTTQVKVAY
jgi:hypothetical protein